MVSKIAWNIVAFNRLRRILRDVPREGPVRYRRFTREGTEPAPTQKT